MKLRERLVKLGNLIDSGTILALFGATIEDLDLLAKAEEMLGTENPRGAK